MASPGDMPRHSYTAEFLPPVLDPCDEHYFIVTTREMRQWREEDRKLDRQLQQRDLENWHRDHGVTAGSAYKAARGRLGIR